MEFSLNRSGGVEVRREKNLKGFGEMEGVNMSWCREGMDKGC